MTYYQRERHMAAHCPFCGSNKVDKTFNFNERVCTLCGCDFKVLDKNIRIFHEVVYCYKNDLSPLTILGRFAMIGRTDLGRETSMFALSMT